MTYPSPVSNPKHTMLQRARQWHNSAGLIAALFLLVLGSSGIVLNYQKPIFNALGLKTEVKPGRMPSSGGKHEQPAFTTATGFAAAAVTTDAALTRARTTLGDVPLERIELKDERGDLFYKVKARGGDEIWINAMTGAHFLKGEYEKVKGPAASTVTRQTDWGKILIDLHTGKIGGEFGKAVVSIAALLLLLLSLSGVYMWTKPALVRLQNARRKQSAETSPSAAAESPA
jgi:uncharacterized iron-regulated membrane protein